MNPNAQGCLVVVLLILVLGVVCAVCITPDEESNYDTGLTQDECLAYYRDATTWFDTPFDELIQASMNDPNSFERLNTRLSATGTRRVIRVEFTGKNAFGGTVRHTATGYLDLDDCTVTLTEIE